MNLSRFEDEVYVVSFKGFEGDGERDIRVKFVKVCEIFYWYKNLKKF